jgi:hypothetical protein
VPSRTPAEREQLIVSLRELRPQDWWANTGYAEAKGEQTEVDTGPAAAEDDVIATYYHDVPPELAAEALRRAAEFMRRVARGRLGITADAFAGGHCVAPSRPVDLTDRFEAYLAEL